MKEISIVIPVYNSHECVAELSRQIKDALKGIEYEQIMVNDCSKDSSWEEIKKESEQNPNLLGINLRKNGGQDSAILTGLNYASGKWIVIMEMTCNILLMTFQSFMRKLKKALMLFTQILKQKNRSYGKI